MNDDHTTAPEPSDTNDSTAEARPLGYWLRTVDALITREFAEALRAEGVDRRDWMTLNVLAGDVDAPGLAERLTRGGKRLRRLEDRGWITEVEGRFELTEEGRGAKERIGAIVDGIRSRVSGAVSPDDYATLTASLEAIAGELGWDGSAADGGRGFTPWRGFGPGRGFGRGFGPGRGFEHVWARGHAEAWARHADEHGARGPWAGPSFHTGDTPGFGPWNHGHWGPGHHGRPDRGESHGHPHHAHHGHGKGLDAERAYERGFKAGFDARQSGNGRTESDAA